MLPSAIPMPGPERALTGMKPALPQPTPPAGTPDAPAPVRVEWSGALRAPEPTRDTARGEMTARMRDDPALGPPPAFEQNVLDTLPDALRRAGTAAPPPRAPALTLDKRL